MTKSQSWAEHNQKITSCELCPRLRAHCLETARIKRKSFEAETYWGLPVPAFGDFNAALVIIGLAPAAHGANRTGRMFTGDRSGEWLYRALYKAGLSNHPRSASSSDSLDLPQTIITASARCAPPDNKPTKEELENCSVYLDWELQHLSTAKVYLALGGIALEQTWKAFLRISPDGKKKIPKFAHGLEVDLNSIFPNDVFFRGKHLICSYHPSQQNTFTGRLTEPMFDSVFAAAKKYF